MAYFDYNTYKKRSLMDEINTKDLSAKDLEVLLLDRYDLYRGEYKEDILKLVTNGTIVLIACNLDTDIPGTRYCNITLNEDMVVVN